ncbi:MAG TPA: metalloregulator ArsR/SmtB family transcription factor [Gemmatimonadales bacterium]|nr:metalloregulator ArsR/SmtB family transcription factor [Gemmatimonadales bacterium]
MAKGAMTAAQLALVAERFKVLAEPVRLQLLQALMAGERTVGELVEATGLSQANVSKHLQLLLAHELVARRKEGLFAYYSLADESVFQLCDLVCSRLERATRERQRRLARG